MKVSQTIKLAAPADAVWTYISDIYNAHEWQPHIASIDRGSKEGERVVHMKRGNTVLDRVVGMDPAKRTLSYEMLPDQVTPPGVPRLEGFLATLTVTEAGANSEVEYSIAVDVPDEIKEMAEKGMGGDIAGALNGLAAKFGTAA